MASQSERFHCADLGVSLLAGDSGDAVIIGVSSIKNLKDNLADLKEKALPKDVVAVIDEAWPVVKGIAPKYWHQIMPSCSIENVECTGWSERHNHVSLLTEDITANI